MGQVAGKGFLGPVVLGLGFTELDRPWEGRMCPGRRVWAEDAHCLCAGDHRTRQDGTLSPLLISTNGALCLVPWARLQLLVPTPHDFSSVFLFWPAGVISEQGLRGEVPPVLQHHILKVALELPTSKFSWLKAQEGPDADIIGGERSVFYLLMKMFVTSTHLQLKSSTKLLIIKVRVFHSL